MSANAASLGNRAAAMRDAFDRSFAAPRPPAPPASEELLAVRIGIEPYLLRLSEIAALHCDRPITKLPGSIAALCGIAGFRGTVVPVYDLAHLLGHPPAEAGRWLALAAGEAVAFSFTDVDRHIRAARDAIIANDAGAESHRHVREFARTTGEAAYPIVDIRSVIDAVRRLISPQSSEGR